MLVDNDLIRLSGLVKNARTLIALNALCKFLSLLAGVAIISLIAGAISSAYTGDAPPGLPGLAVILCTLAIGKMAFSFLSGEFAYRTAAGIKVRLREAIFNKLVELDSGHRESAGTSSAVSLAIDGVEALETYYGRYLPQLAYCVAAPIFLFLYISSISLLPALALLAAVPLMPLSMRLVDGRAKRETNKYWDSYEKLSGYFLESLQGLPTLKMLGRENDRIKSFAGAAWAFRDNTMRVLRVQLLSLMSMDFVAYAGAALGVLIAAYSLRSGSLAIGGAVVILLLAPEFFLPFRTLGSYYHSGMAGSMAGKKILKFLETRPAIDKKARGVTGGISGAVPCIRFDRVRFSYDGAKNALNDFCMTVEANSRVAIVGRSGSGKSTVARLCVRFYDPDDGKVTIEDVDLKQVSPDDVRSMITVVSQNSYIFTGSIADNLKIAKPDATDDEMMEACRKAGLQSYVWSFKDGLNAPVGEWGRLMSGGQRQRLALARAILRDTPIYVFDEATSGVDSATEEQLLESIANLARNKTSIIISHRLASIRDADRIFVMDSGRVIEEGSHEELMSMNGTYANMVREQESMESGLEPEAVAAGVTA